MYVVLLLLIGAVVAAHVLFLLIKTRLSVESIKLWWLKHYKEWPARREGTCWCSRLVQDVIFRLDKQAYMLNYTKLRRERIKIQQALYCDILDPEVIYALQGYEEKSTEVKWGTSPRQLHCTQLEESWHRTREPTYLAQGLQEGMPWALNILELACGDVMDFTQYMQDKWETTEKDGAFVKIAFEALSENPVLVLIEYMGHSDIAAGIPAGCFKTVYMGMNHTSRTSFRFPPLHPDVQVARGLGVRRLLYATVGGLDITEDMKALCGPLSDFFVKSNPLTFIKLWFGLWVTDSIQSLGLVTIEDSQLETTRL